MSKVILLQILLFSSYSHASFEKALEIYSAGRFDEAKSAFGALAAIGGHLRRLSGFVRAYQPEQTPTFCVRGGGQLGRDPARS